MDNQTRFGIGGIAIGAVFAFVPLIWPTMPLAVSGTGFVVGGIATMASGPG
jgi:hypothetical protein